MPVRRPRAVLFSPDDADGASAGLRRLPRVMTGYSTVLLDLTREADDLRAALEGRWRNRLAAAERSVLRVQRVGGKPAQYGWLIGKEEAQLARRSYGALPRGFVEAYQRAKPGGDAVFTLRANLGRDTVAGMMFLLHGDAATYHIGWSDDAGRKLSAHNLLLWQAMLALKANGVRRLDLGGVNTGRSAGIARFKIGSGGQVVTLAGTCVRLG